MINKTFFANIMAYIYGKQFVLWKVVSMGTKLTFKSYISKMLHGSLLDHQWSALKINIHKKEVNPIIGVDLSDQKS